jgi:diaminopimelate epimerase
MADNRLRIAKLHGCGNDFILADGADVPLEERSALSVALCRRRTSIGADGLILVNRLADDLTYVDFYNPDGSQAEMCGNGSRCAARFAVEALGVSPRHQMDTVSGVLDAEMQSPDTIRVVMPDPSGTQLSHATVDGIELHHVQVGVPHTVVLVDDMSAWPDARLREFGRGLRFDATLYPQGTNLNIVAPASNGRWRVRTYERGVEDITLACGTGNTATAHILSALGKSDFPFRSLVDGGELSVELIDGRHWLCGPAKWVLSGSVDQDAFSV